MTQITIRPAGYSGLQKILHWVIALMAVALAILGLAMVRRGAVTNFDAVTNQMYTNHKTAGFILLLLMVWRITIRIRRGLPPPEPTLTRLQVVASETVHRMIYLMLFIVPLLGWAGVSAYGARGIRGGLSLPPILPVNQSLGEVILKFHGRAALVLFILVAGHVAAALMHRFVLKDGVLKRMLP